MRDLKGYFRAYPNLFVETNVQLMLEKLFYLNHIHFFGF